MNNEIETIEELLEFEVKRGIFALSEYESKRVLASYGIPVVKEALVQNAAEAVDMAEQMGYPVVVKPCSPSLMHKSDQGLVKLNLDNTQSVQRVITEIHEAVDGAPLDGYLVQRMVRGKRELIVGGIRDKLFGPCVMLGLGGILVEALADVTFRLAPLDERDADEMVNGLHSQRIFGAVRGEPPVDRVQMSQVLIGVGRILAEHPRIHQIDVNPLIIEGSQPVAVDALITLVSSES